MTGEDRATKWVTLLGVVITALLSYLSVQRTAIVHQLVNSQFSQAKAEIAEANVTIAVLLRRIAVMSDTTEDQIRAEIAEELTKRRVSLPKEGPK